MLVIFAQRIDAAIKALEADIAEAARAGSIPKEFLSHCKEVPPPPLVQDNGVGTLPGSLSQRHGTTPPPPPAARPSSAEALSSEAGAVASTSGREENADAASQLDFHRSLKRKWVEITAGQPDSKLRAWQLKIFNAIKARGGDACKKVMDLLQCTSPEARRVKLLELLSKNPRDREVAGLIHLTEIRNKQQQCLTPAVAFPTVPTTTEGQISSTSPTDFQEEPPALPTGVQVSSSLHETPREPVAGARIEDAAAAAACPGGDMSPPSTTAEPSNWTTRSRQEMPASCAPNEVAAAAPQTAAAQPSTSEPPTAGDPGGPGWAVVGPQAPRSSPPAALMDSVTAVPTELPSANGTEITTRLQKPV